MHRSSGSEKHFADDWPNNHRQQLMMVESSRISFTSDAFLGQEVPLHYGGYKNLHPNQILLEDTVTL